MSLIALRRFAVVFTLLAALPAARAAGEGATTERAALAGTVTDPSGAPVAGAPATLSPGSGEARRAVTDARGRFAFAELLPGRYRLEIADPRFAPVELPVALGSGERLDLPIALELRPLAETVDVTGAAGAALERVPGGVALVRETEIARTRANSVEDVFFLTPGVLAPSRWGADEARVSVRGSGLRNNFHMRGLNVFVNGIPYQEADGFTDFETIEVMAARYVEVFKGANALRFGGNTMGGAVNFVTPTGETAPPLLFRGVGGSFESWKGQLANGGKSGDLAWYGTLSASEMEGYRDHSEQERLRFLGNLRWAAGPSTDFGLDLVYADVSEKLPGSLTAAEMEADSRQANPENVNGDWGRFYDYGRVAASFRRRFGSSSLGVTAYGHYRNMDHPIFQVLDQDARNFGVEARYSYDGRLLGRPGRFVAGFAPQLGTVSERRYVNDSGERGLLVNRFGTRARNLGAYAEAQLDLSSTFTLVAGARADSARREYEDRFPEDGDRSDRRTYEAVSPKVGFLARTASGVQFFGNASRSYEAPLLLELTSFGAPGFVDLPAQDTWQFELGSRGSAGARLRWDVAAYQAEVKDEILNVNLRPFPGAPFTIPSYRSADRTRHRGLEVGAEADLAGDGGKDGLHLRAAYTLSDFRFVDDPVYGGNRLPGAPHHLVRAELRLEREGFWLSPTLDWSPASFYADSANTVTSRGYAVLGVRAGLDRKRWGLFLEAVNLLDEAYSASVQVDSADGRFFEPSVPRSIHGGIRVSLDRR